MLAFTDDAILTAIVGIVIAIFQVWTFKHIAGMARNIQKVETATNSMKDALVLATEKEALLRGASEERDRGDRRATTLLDKTEKKAEGGG